MSEQRNGWWPGLPRPCPNAPCLGTLILDPPTTLDDGEVKCLLCARVVADVKGDA